MNVFGPKCTIAITPLSSALSVALLGTGASALAAITIAAAAIAANPTAIIIFFIAVLLSSNSYKGFYAFSPHILRILYT